MQVCADLPWSTVQTLIALHIDNCLSTNSTCYRGCEHAEPVAQQRNAPRSPRQHGLQHIDFDAFLFTRLLFALQYQQCYLDETTGDVIVIYHETTIVRVGSSATLTLCIHTASAARLSVMLPDGNMVLMSPEQETVTMTTPCYCRSRRRGTSHSTRGASTRCAAAGVLPCKLQPMQPSNSTLSTGVERFAC